MLLISFVRFIHVRTCTVAFFFGFSFLILTVSFEVNEGEKGG